eukprot:3094411-Pleurochrysis_carterae.AAC.1
MKKLGLVLQSIMSLPSGKCLAIQPNHGGSVVAVKLQISMNERIVKSSAREKSGEKRQGRNSKRQAGREVQGRRYTVAAQNTRGENKDCTKPKRLGRWKDTKKYSAAER